MVVTEKGETWKRGGGSRLSPGLNLKGRGKDGLALRGIDPATL